MERKSLLSGKGKLFALFLSKSQPEEGNSPFPDGRTDWGVKSVDGDKVLSFQSRIQRNRPVGAFLFEYFMQKRAEGRVCLQPAKYDFLAISLSEFNKTQSIWPSRGQSRFEINSATVSSSGHYLHSFESNGLN